AGLKPNIAVTLSHVGLIAAYASAGLGLTFVPSLAVRAEVNAGHVKCAAIDDVLFGQTRFVLCRHKTRPPTLPARAFIAALRLHFARQTAARPKTTRQRRK